ncbi:Uncharacterized protein Adt_41677 [Abeliophyllum distichum]|uniref:Uncharacterized protein n=1 Tax=Abeliophyllum distichum TaxID=126358 RepID=A0ABD1PPH9_9LAMI
MENRTRVRPTILLIILFEVFHIPWSAQSTKNNLTEFTSSATPSLECYRPQVDQEGRNMIPNYEFGSISSFNNSNTMACNSSGRGSESYGIDQNQKDEKNPPLSFLEKWLLDENACQEGMELPQIF